MWVGVVDDCARVLTPVAAGERVDGGRAMSAIVVKCAIVVLVTLAELVAGRRGGRYIDSLTRRMRLHAFDGRQWVDCGWLAPTSCRRIMGPPGWI
jgi:hypothetical protein